VHRTMRSLAAVLILSLAVTVIPVVAAEAAAAPITGTVWRDHNQNGEQDNRDPGWEGVTVTATDPAGAVTGTAVSGADGSFSIVGTDDTIQYRITYSWTEPFLRPTAVGPDTAGSVQFVNGGGVASFGLANPADFCAADEAVVVFATTCFVNGDPTTADAFNADVEAIVAVPRANGIAGNGLPDAIKLAEAGQLGSTYGLAFEPVSNRLFASSYLKRHVGLGASGLNTIYSVNLNDSSVGPWYSGIDAGAGAVLSNAARGLPSSAADNPASVDATVFGQVGKAGWGDIDISEDQQTIYAVNLFDREVYAIDVAAVDNGAGNADVSIGRPTLSCPNGVDRPFGLQIKDGLLYLGVTCTAENGGTQADLSGHVFTYDIAGGTWSPDSVLDIPLNYADGCLVRNRGCEMYPWIDTFSYADFFFTAVPATPFEFPLRAQPMIADIDFDTDGSMIVGIRDRQGDQFGNRNFTPLGDGNLITAATNGDLLKAAPPSIPGGKFTLESGGVVGGQTSSGTGTTNVGAGGPAAPQGPGGGEFFWSDFVTGPGGDVIHSETFMGSIAVIPGTDTVAATSLDPQPARLDAGGISWVNLDNGATEESIELYRDGSTPAPSTFGKANGLGDLEALCLGARVEIGNRVWFDRNQDGNQDAGEEPIPNVSITLSDGQVTTTDANGNWGFTVNPQTDYTVTLDPLAADVSGIPEISTGADLLPTILGPIPAVGQPRDLLDPADLVDSDMDPTNLTITVRTEGPGRHDFSLDAGFTTSTGLEIGNLVWLDADNDGVAETGEPGIASVVVELWEDTTGDGEKDTFRATTTTNADGNYRFPNLAPGAYGILVPDQSAAGQPLAGMISSGPTAANANDDADNDDNGLDPPSLPAAVMSSVIQLTGTEPLAETARSDSQTIDSPAAGTNDDQSNLTVDFGFFPTSGLGNYVWFDANADGLQDPGEAPVPGVTIQLCRADGTIEATTTTDVNGFYQFINLIPGDYKICVPLDLLPTGSSITTADVGADEAADSDVNPQTGMSEVVTISAGQFYPDLDLGLIPPGSVGNVVWMDTNGDGMQGPDEPGVPGVVVILCNEAGDTLASVTTDQDGRYLFDELTPGNYWICFDLNTLPTGTEPVDPGSGGDDAIDSDPDRRTGVTSLIPIGPGVFVDSIDLGLQVVDQAAPPELALTGTSLTAPLIGYGLILAGIGVGLIAIRRNGFRLA